MHSSNAHFLIIYGSVFSLRSLRNKEQKTSATVVCKYHLPTVLCRHPIFVLQGQTKENFEGSNVTKTRSSCAQLFFSPVHTEIKLFVKHTQPATKTCWFPSAFRFSCMQGASISSFILEPPTNSSNAFSSRTTLSEHLSDEY